MSAISVSGVSKAYKLGEINRGMLWEDARRWLRRLRGGREFESEDHLFWALKDVSFEIARGETVGIIGTNGAGKSTLLKLLSRITLPTTGLIRLDGRTGSLLEVGTGFNLFMTGRENIFLNGSILGLKKEEIGRRFDDIVAFAGVEEFIDTPVKHYSSGMRVRLAFAVASFMELEILILDEVLAVGDMAFQKKCFDRMQHLTEQGHTTLFVSHDIGAIVKFCSRVLWLEKGHVRFDGPAEEGCDLYRKQEMLNASSSEFVPGNDGVYRYDQGREPAGTGDWKLSSFAVLDSNGKAATSIKLGASCQFRIGFTCPDPSNLPEPRFAVIAVNDEHGRRVFALRSDVCGIPFDSVPGSGTIVVDVPRLPLLPGVYSFFLRLSAREQTSDVLQSAARIAVDDGRFYDSGHTPVRAFTPLCVEARARLAS